MSAGRHSRAAGRVANRRASRLLNQVPRQRAPKEGQYTSLVLLTPCPTCEATPGDKCRRVNESGWSVNTGKVMAGPHTERIEAAR